MEALSPHNVVDNCRLAFEVAERLGIPRVIEPSDMSMLAVPDKLAVITYLYQLRAHFTGHQLQIEQIGNTADESSYVIGNYKSDNLPSQNLLSFDHLKKQLSAQQQQLQQQQQSFDDDCVDDRTPNDKKDMKNLILTGSKHFLGKVLSPVKDKQQQIAINNNNKIQANTMTTPSALAKDGNILMTRRELTDPFGSDDDDDNSDEKQQQQHQQSESQKTTHASDVESQRNNAHVNKAESPISNLDPATANVSNKSNTHTHTHQFSFRFDSFLLFLRSQLIRMIFHLC